MDRRVVVVYKSDNDDIGEALAKLRKELDGFNPTYIPREQLLEQDTRNALVIIAGGDGTLLGASHRILDNYSIVLGVRLNSKSKGYYTTTNLNGLAYLVARVLNRKFVGYKIDRLPRLECVMHTDSGNWVKTDLAINEFLISNTCPYLPSRYTIKVVDNRGYEEGAGEYQRSSGVVISTMQGFTGWVKNIPGSIEPDNPENISVVVRECMESTKVCNKVFPYNLTSFLVDTSHQKLFIISEMHRGFVVPDAFDEYPFNRGTEIEIRMSDHPLNLVRRV